MWGRHQNSYFQLSHPPGTSDSKIVLVIVAQDACESLGDIQWISRKNRGDVVEIEYFLLLTELFKNCSIMIPQKQPQLCRKQKLLDGSQFQNYDFQRP